jgi:hypothetical protein
MQVGIFWTDDGEKKKQKMRSEQSDSDDVTYLIASQQAPPHSDGQEQSTNLLRVYIQF